MDLWDHNKRQYCRTHTPTHTATFYSYYYKWESGGVWESGKGTADTTVTSSNNNNMSFCWAVAQTAIGGGLVRGGSLCLGLSVPHLFPTMGHKKECQEFTGYKEQGTGESDKDYARKF